MTNRVLSILNARMGLLAEGGWVAAGQLISAVGALIAIRVITELLSPAAFGELVLLVGMAALAQGLACTPQLQALIRFYPSYEMSGRISLLRSVGVRMVLPKVVIAALLITTISAAYSVFTDHSPIAGLWTAGLLLVDCTRSFELVLLNAARRQRTCALIFIADAWARPIGAAVAVSVFGHSAAAALAGYFFGASMVTGATLLVLRRQIRSVQFPMSSSTDFRQLQASIRQYALPLVPMAVFGWISGVGDRFLVGGLLGLGQAGLYAAAHSLASRPFLMMAGITEMTLRPILQAAIASHHKAKIRLVQKIYLVTSSLVSILGVAAFFLLSRVVGDAFLSEDFRSAAAIMPWIAVGYALYTTSNVYSRFCYAFDDTKAALTITAIGCMACIALIVPAVSQFGIYGAVGALVLGFGIQLGLSGYLAHRAQRRYEIVHCIAEAD